MSVSWRRVNVSRYREIRITNQAVLTANSRILCTWSETARDVNGDAANAMFELAKKTSANADRLAKDSVERLKEMVVGERQADLISLHRNLQDLSGRTRWWGEYSPADEELHDEPALASAGA